MPAINRISTNTGIPIATPVKSVIGPAPLLDGSEPPTGILWGVTEDLGFEVVTGTSAVVERVAAK